MVTSKRNKIRCKHCGEVGHEVKDCELFRRSQAELRVGIKGRYQRGLDECRKAVRAWAVEFKVTDKTAREQIREAL